MNPKEALTVLEQALNVATQKGAFTLEDCSTILQAIQTLKTTVK
jgi:hypothetical protein